MAVRTPDKPRTAPPIGAAKLQELALAYAGRYATTRARLAAYLKRKVRERGWEGAPGPDIEGLVERMAALGYVDDRAFADAKAAALGRRGYGPRRIDATLRAAGISDADAEEARDAARENAWDAALGFARRKRIGPFAAQPHDLPAREKAFAAMLRAGHQPAHARRIVQAAPGEVPDRE